MAPTDVHWHTPAEKTYGRAPQSVIRLLSSGPQSGPFVGAKDVC